MEFKVLEPVGSNGDTIESYVILETLASKNITVGCYYNMVNYYIREPVVFNMEVLEDILTQIYNISHCKSLIDIVRHIVRVINKFDMEENEYMCFVNVIQTLLTSIINYCLKYNIRSEANVDDILLDVEELVKYFNKPEQVKQLNRAKEYIMAIFINNKENLHAILEDLETSKKDLGNGVYLYKFNILVPNPVCGIGVNPNLQVYTLDSKLKNIGNHTLITKDTTEHALLYEFLEHLKQNSREFNDYGFIIAYRVTDMLQIVRHRIVVFDTVDGYLIVR